MWRPEDATDMNSVFQENGRGTDLIMTQSFTKAWPDQTGCQSSEIIVQPSHLTGDKTRAQKKDVTCMDLVTGLDDNLCLWLLKSELFAPGHIVSACPCLLLPSSGKPSVFVICFRWIWTKQQCLDSSLCSCLYLEAVSPTIFSLF